MGGDLNDQVPASTQTDEISLTEKISAVLTELDRGGHVPTEVTQTPGEFLRDFYEAWLENGGLEGGKNRNSVRKMRNWLTDEAEVRSLHPKLKGSVRISKDDACALIDLFLSRWKYLGIKEEDNSRTPDGYRPFPCGNSDKLRENLVDAMFPSDLGILLPARAPARARKEISQTTWDDITNLFGESDAVITLSRHRTAIGATPAETMANFYKFLLYLRREIKNDDLILIWVVDVGSRQAEDQDSWLEFYNFETLKTQFRAFATFDSTIDHEVNRNPEKDTKNNAQTHDSFLRLLEIQEEQPREERWRWLCEHAVIVVLNLRDEEFSELYADEDRHAGNPTVKDVGVTAEHILPSILPDRWGPNLRGIYGKNIQNLDEATITVYFRMAGWNEGVRENRNHGSSDIRYFAHALVPQQSRDDTSWVDTIVSHEVDTPGPLYDEAFRIVYWAARYRLKEWRGSIEGRERMWALASAYVRKQGFQVLRLPEFMRINRLPGD